MKRKWLLRSRKLIAQDLNGVLNFKIMKKTLLICFFLVTSFSFSQSWSFQDGYNAGKHYREINRQDMFIASYNSAQENGQTNYALGMREGWETNEPNSGGQPSYINIAWDWLTGGDIDWWWECLDGSCDGPPEFDINEIGL